ncbi:MAG: spore maturation protein [Oscillospiraceae bacterium]|nr:spore maturation protein [Oscillospiraceae bacterium]
MTDLLVPLILAVSVLTALFRNVDFYSALGEGAAEGLRVLLRILPPLVGLMTAIFMFRASGLLETLGAVLAPLLNALGIPPETIGLMLIRPVSGSGALGVGADLIRSHGPDSLVGRTAAVMLGSTETTFYTIAVYFGAAKINKTRYAIPAALCADLTGFLVASWTVRHFF